MNHSTSSLSSINNHSLHLQKWTPDGDIKAIVCLVHGLGEHSGRYAPMADFLNQSGILCIAYDHPGHGQSEGKKGHIKNYEAFLDNTDKVVRNAIETYPNIPIYLYGHSMGGGIVANYILRRNTDHLSGAILSSPWFKLAFQPPAFRVMLAKIMVNIYPSYTESSNLDIKNISRIPEEVARYDQDTLIHKRVSPSTYLGAFQAGTWALEHADKLSLRTLLLHGTGDQVTSFDASKEFVSKAPKDVLTFKEWKDSYHETHYDLDREQVMQSIADFVLGTVKK